MENNYRTLADKARAHLVRISNNTQKLDQDLREPREFEFRVSVDIDRTSHGGHGRGYIGSVRKLFEVYYADAFIFPTRMVAENFIKKFQEILVNPAVQTTPNPLYQEPPPVQPRTTARDKQIEKCWTFTSSSNPDLFYQTLRYHDGSLACNCPGWVNKKGGARTCRHVRSVQLGTADREAESFRSYSETADYSNKPQPAKAKASATLIERAPRKLDL